MDKPDRDELLEERRQDARRRLDTASPRCRECGATEVLALTGVFPDILCYECQAEAQGCSTREKHHLLGRALDANATVDVPGNDHRVLSTLQDAWPTATRQARTGSPLRKAAALLRGWLDILRQVLDRVDGVVELVEALDRWLEYVRGPRWWNEFESWRKNPRNR